VLYAISGRDSADSLALRVKTRAAHLKHVQTLVDQGRLLLAGPYPAIDSPEPGPAGFSGSLIIAEFESLEDAKAWANSDPYLSAGVFEAVDVKPFVQVLP
jgi:uncharacterized protein